jgi:hypothetical protein
MFGRNNQRQRQSVGSGFGFQGSSPPFPYTGRGKGGLPRCQYQGNISYLDTSLPGFRSRITLDQELDMLKRQAGNIRNELEIIESRIRNLESNKKE